MFFHRCVVVVVLFGIVSSFRISLPKSQPFKVYSHRRSTRAPNPFYQHSPSFIARPGFMTYHGTENAYTTRSPRKYSLQSVFQRLISAVDWFLSKFKSQPTQVHVEKENRNVKRTTNTTFLSAPSVPINKMINLSIGRQYAQAKLQEIDSYFKKIGSGKSSSGVTSTGEAVEVNSTQLQIQQTYERKRSVLEIPDEDLKGKRVLLRCNLDVPVQDGNVTEDYALRQSLPTIQHLTDRGARVIIAGHRGHPLGEGYEAQSSLSPVAARLGELLNQSVAMISDYTVETMERTVSALSEGGVVVLENLRFHHEETQNNTDFARNLTAHVDIFVNDDFSSSHLAHASTQGVARLVSTAVTGLALKKDLDMFHVSWLNVSTPLVAVVGVGNLTTQASFLDNLVKMKPDRVILTGPLAVPFQHARGDSVGNETVVAEEVELAYHLDERSAKQSLRISLCPEYKNTTFPWMMDATYGNGTLLWAGAEESQPEVPFLRAMTRGTNHTFSCYDNVLEMFKGNALPGVCFLNKL